MLDLKRLVTKIQKTLRVQRFSATTGVKPFQNFEILFKNKNFEAHYAKSINSNLLYRSPAGSDFFLKKLISG